MTSTELFGRDFHSAFVSFPSQLIQPVRYLWGGATQIEQAFLPYKQLLPLDWRLPFLESSVDRPREVCAIS